MLQFHVVCDRYAFDLACLIVKAGVLDLIFGRDAGVSIDCHCASPQLVRRYVTNALTLCKLKIVEFFRRPLGVETPGGRGVLAENRYLSGYTHATPRNWQGAGGVKNE
jgi:hypothetical protein